MKSGNTIETIVNYLKANAQILSPQQLADEIKKEYEKVWEKF